MTTTTATTAATKAILSTLAMKNLYLKDADRIDHILASLKYFKFSIGYNNAKY